MLAIDIEHRYRIDGRIPRAAAEVKAEEQDMMSIGQDIRHAARALAKHPGYLATAVCTLALGIGFTTATFSVINAVLLRPLPFTDPERLVLLRERKLPQLPEFSVSPGHYLAWRDQTTAFDGLAAFGVEVVNLDTGSADPQRVRADRITANLFPLLGAAPVVGRAFTSSDDVDGAPRVTLLSYGAWQAWFGGRPDALGRTIRLDSEPYTIVGVMPAHFAFPDQETDLWVPMAFTADERTRLGSHYLSSVARLRRTVTLDRARADINTVASRLAQSSADSSAGWEVLVFPLQEYSVRNVKRALLVLLGAVALVLLIACVNVANLLLVRGAARSKELAIRAAIGASRPRLVRQLLVEQLVLATLSATIGLLAAGWLLRALLALVPNALPRQGDIGLDGSVLAFALVLAIVTPFLFGLVPAVQASRADLRELLAAGGRQSGHATGQRLRRVLVVAELALAMMLLVGAGLLIRSFSQLAHVSPGFVPDHAILASVSLPASRYAEGDPREHFFDELLSRIRSLPGVTATGLSQSVPMLTDFVSGLEIEGRPPVTSQNQPTTNFYAVSPGYFQAMRIPIIRGRSILASDRRGALRVVVINQALADRQFPGENPIGRRIKVSQGPSDWREIVGIAGDVKQYGLNAETPMQVYESYLQHPYFTTFSIVVRTSAEDPTSVVPQLRSIVRTLDRQLPLSRVRTLDDVVSASIRPQRFSATLIGLFSVAALVLAAVGVYGVMSYTVRLRTQELAIRIAHGATWTDILSLVLRGALTMAAIGIGAGIAGAWLLRQLLAKLLFGVSANDGATYAVVALLLSTVAILASTIPALRATRVDPLVALRES
jgi:putative ABC transport system permease protein